MSFTSEFKAFAMRGNFVDLAVGVVIGAAFGKIVASFVADIVMPPLGLAVGGIDFSQLAVILRDNADPTKVVALRYGAFLQTVLDFLIIALAIFVVIRLINRMRAKEAEKPAEPPAPT
ncbi:MAG: large-conductance mechanosensitive channel protein MscL, partial [Nannocystis sp.]